MFSAVKLVNTLFSVILFFAFSSCEEKITIDDKDPVTSTGPGSISVTVTGNIQNYDSQGAQPIALVRVITHPYTKEYFTDQVGKVLIKDIPAGDYAIVAVIELDYYGENVLFGGKEYVKVVPDAMANSNISLVRNVGLAPALFSSLSEKWIAQDEEAILSLTAVDLLTQGDSLTLSVASSLSGNLFKGVMDLNGTKTLKISNLVAGEHEIWVEVGNKKGLIAQDTLLLTNTAPHKATLTASLNEAQNIVLDWSKPSDSDFLKYEIKRATNSYYQSDSVTVTEINDESIKQYTDSSFPIADQVYYKVNCITTTGNVRVGKWISIRPKFSIMGNMDIFQSIFDPEKPVFYAIVTGNKLTAWNLETKTKIAEINAPPVNSNLPKIMTVGKNNGKSELYVLSTDNSIYIFDGETLSLKDTILTTGSLLGIAYREPGILVVSSKQLNDTYSTLTSYNSVTHSKLSSYGPSYEFYYSTNLVPRPGTSSIMIFDDYSSSYAKSIEVSSTGIFGLIQSYSVSGGSYSGALDRFSKFSPNGNYICSAYNYGTVFLFGTSILAIGSLNIPNNNQTSLEFSSDNKKLFAQIYNKREIRAFNVSPFSATRNLTTKSFPVLLKCYGSKLYMIGQKEYDTYNGKAKIIESFDI